MEHNNPIKDKKINFFKRVWYSTTKFEKYPQMAALGIKNAIIYFTELMLIFSILSTMIYVYYISNSNNFEDNALLSERIIRHMESVYDNQELSQDFQALTEFSEYSNSAIIFILFISIFISFYLTTFLDVFTLSVFGLLTCFIAKIKMNYKAVFNMSIYALTLSIILKIVYIALQMLAGFEIKYFDIMYIAVSYICLAAAIFMIKSDVIKQQLELMKIIKEGKEKIEQTITIPKKPKEDDDGEEENKEDVDKEEDNNTEEQGSNA